MSLEIAAKVLKLFCELKEFIIVYSDNKINKIATFKRIAFFAIQGAIISILVVICLKTKIFGNIFYKTNKISEKINQESDIFLTQCGTESYIFWFVLEDSNLGINSARGCKKELKKNRCKIIPDLKELNPAWQGEYSLDYNSLEKMNEIEEGKYWKTDDIESMSKYDTFYRIVKKSRVDLETVGFVFIKDYKKSVIHIFTLGFAKGAERNCIAPWSALEDFALKMKKSL